MCKLRNNIPYPTSINIHPDVFPRQITLHTCIKNPKIMMYLVNQVLYKIAEYDCCITIVTRCTFPNVHM